VTPEERVRIAKHALSGQHLTGWWAEDWKGARSAAVSARSCWARSGEWGETRANGVHVWFGARYEGPPPGLDERDFEKRVRPADVILTWREVHEVVERGATPERRAAYVAAHRAYAEQMTTPVPHPNRPRRPGKGWDYFTDPKNVAPLAGEHGRDPAAARGVGRDHRGRVCGLGELVAGPGQVGRRANQPGGWGVGRAGVEQVSVRAGVREAVRDAGAPAEVSDLPLTVVRGKDERQEHGHGLHGDGRTRW
jgi:hypothetical protein